MAVNFSYINADGIETILDSDETRDLWVMKEISGIGAPIIHCTEQEYGNGYSKIVASQLGSRTIVLNMVCHGADKYNRDRIFHNMVDGLVQVGSKDDWGKLKIRRSDGVYVYLNCMYSSGANSVRDKYTKFHKFSLSFKTGDPFFYNYVPVRLNNNTEALRGLKLHDELYLSENLYLFGMSHRMSITVENSGTISYPVITVTGPAETIKFYNAATGKEIALIGNFGLIDGQKMTIDCREMKRKLTLTDTNGADSDISYMLGLGSSLNWPFLHGTNQLTVTLSDTTPNSMFEIEYSVRYLAL